MAIAATSYGTTPDGVAVTRYTLANANGMAADVIGYGGIVTALRVPDRTGSIGNVALGCRTLDDYLRRHPYFGAITGRFANRLGRARFALDGTEYQLAANDGANALHGGTRGFDRQHWTAEPVTAADGDRLLLRRVSPDGEEGYPGALTVEVAYTVTARNELRIDYTASTDRPTVLNLTNHSYFNLAGEAAGSVLGHVMTIHADRYTPVDAELTPTGELAPVAGTPLDFTTPIAIGARIRDAHPQLVIGRGYDHNWVLRKTRPGALEPAARVFEPSGGRIMEVETSEPGVQFYTGNFLDGSLLGSGGTVYRQSDGFCLETQHFPDSPNQPSFPSTVLRPGTIWRSTTIYRFLTDAVARAPAA